MEESIKLMVDDLSRSIFKIVSSKIKSEKVARQFILEELEAASYGDHFAKDFAKNSGFKQSEYMGAMNNSMNEVDGDGGPQQTLLGHCMAIGDMNLIVQVRIKVVKKIIEKYKLGYYQ